MKDGFFPSSDIVVVGAGYVGLVSGACLAHLGNKVHIVDSNAQKIDTLNRGQIPIFEPGLSEIVLESRKKGRLFFHSDLSETLKIQKPGFIFLAVGTPDRPDGSCNTDFLFAAFDGVLDSVSQDTILVVKSTVPVGTSSELNKKLQKKSSPYNIHIINNPEFLKEGHAVEDFLRPERVVLGGNSSEALSAVERLYEPVVRGGAPIFKTDPATAELSKLSANLALASRVSLINQIAQLSDVVGANVRDIEKILKSDSRIGGKYLYAGLGFGGSCFPKDIKNFVTLCKNLEVPSPFAQAVLVQNEIQKKTFLKPILNAFPKPEVTTLAIWGVAFKPNTDDIRESPTLVLIEELTRAGFSVKVHDPKALPSFSEWLNQTPHVPSHKITQCSTKEDALLGAKALVVATEWPEYAQGIELSLKNYFKGTHVFDGKNLYKPKHIRELGFIYRGIGQS